MHRLTDHRGKSGGPDKATRSTAGETAEYKVTENEAPGLFKKCDDACVHTFVWNRLYTQLCFPFFFNTYALFAILCKMVFFKLYVKVLRSARGQWL